MTDSNDGPKSENKFRFTIEELDELQSETTGFIKHRLITWAIRWTIGFAMIWLVVLYWPHLIWLWWIGGGVAAASLTFLFLAQWLMSRRMSQTADHIRQAEGKRDQ